MTQASMRRSFASALVLGFGAFAASALLAASPAPAHAADVSAADALTMTGPAATSLFTDGVDFNRELTSMLKGYVSEHYTEHPAPITNEPQPLALSFDEHNVIDIEWGWDLFTGDPSVYNPNLALAGLTLCQAAKTSQNDVETHLQELGFEYVRSEYYDNIFTLHHPATTFAAQAVTLGGERKAIVAIVVRGTDSAGDVFTDLSAAINGFSHAAANVRGRFERYFGNLSAHFGFDVHADNTILFITGHSLGGAVAGQLAEQLEQTGNSRDTIFCYTFGSPRYDTAEDREQYTNIHNIVNVQDPWPYLPFGFEKNGNIWTLDSFDERYQTALDEIYATEGWETKTIEDRHDPPTYLALLTEHALNGSS